MSTQSRYLLSAAAVVTYERAVERWWQREKLEGSEVDLLQSAAQNEHHRRHVRVGESKRNDEEKKK